MCCCCKCCNKLFKILCSVIWAAVAVALIIAIIIFAVAWGGSKVMQDVMSTLIKCGINSNTSSGCTQTFGAYIESISDYNNLECLDVLVPNTEGAFGWIIDFNSKEKKGLGVYARLSSNGIKEGVQNIFVINGVFGSTTEPVRLNIPVNTLDKNGNVITDKEKQYIIHDQYMRLRAIGECPSGACPTPVDSMYSITVNQVAIHLRISFKSVPDFINITINDNSLNYEKFVKVLHDIVKVFSKSAADAMKDSMQDLQARVTDFQGGVECPIATNYVDTPAAP